ncbi:MAG: glutamine-hydrolyzing carbamoyl-phosphate synthase small subunit [Candidatus Dasytiphilus stammeri]
MIKPVAALLVLEDGTQFHGISIGVDGITVGEVVFNTSMTGYQEIITDPSYSHQIVVFTYPHIGNVGTNLIDRESNKIHVKGIIVRNLSLIASNYRNEENLSDYLQRYKVVAIADIDTRKLTRLLREKGVQNGCIVIGDNKKNAELALKKARAFTSLIGMDLVKIVSTKKIYTWKKYNSKKILSLSSSKINPYHVVAYDYGIKNNILCLLGARGCKITVVPAQTPAKIILKFNPDGIFLSNGPGDPRVCYYAIEAIKIFLKQNIPIFGICLGHQLLALASGAKIIKMKFGHHGCNHPVQDLSTGKVLITTQNHGFTIQKSTLPSNIEITHKSLFDSTIQGIKFIDKPFFSFQGHPEASPGPHDATGLFDYFIDLLATYRRNCSYSP